MKRIFVNEKDNFLEKIDDLLEDKGNDIEKYHFETSKNVLTVIFSSLALFFSHKVNATNNVTNKNIRDI